ncbi:MAG TPA: hypothetical protein VGP88_09170 [Thermoplasmata archaeon]|nr:hypothetical protein [Thermoplasmata archaeon]
MAGDPFPPSLWWEGALADRLRLYAPAGAPTRIRWIRREGPRAIVEIDHRIVPAARLAWNVSLVTPAGRPVQLATFRSWGTMRLAKAWLRGPMPAPGRRGHRRADPGPAGPASE